MGNEEIEVCDFDGFPTKDGKARGGMRDITAGTS